MTIQRKVKYKYAENCKGNTINCRNSSTNGTSTNQPKKLKSSGLGKFVYPICGKIPAGQYFSTIKAAKCSKTSKGEDTVLVYYEIQNAIKLYNIVCNGYPPETQDETFYIIQSYPVGRHPYLHFEDAMATNLNLEPYEEFTLDDIVGITELVTLSYEKVDGFGGFESRRPYKLKDFYNSKLYYQEHEDEFDDFPECEESEECEEYDDSEYIDEYYDDGYIR